MPYNGHMLTTVVTPVLPNSATSRAIGELTCQQTTAYNEAVALLNRGITIHKRSTRKEPHGFNNLLTKWRHTQPFLRKVPYSIHQTGWEQAWEANERMRDQSTLRRKRIERAQTHGQHPKKRDTRQHRRTLAHRHRKDNPSLTITEGRRLSAKGHTITFEHRYFSFTIHTKHQGNRILKVGTAGNPECHRSGAPSIRRTLSKSVNSDWSAAKLPACSSSKIRMRLPCTKHQNLDLFDIRSIQLVVEHL